MNKNIEYSFNTRAGSCIITKERIVLERHGFRRALSNLVYGETMTRAIVLYGLIVAVTFGFGGWAITEGSYIVGTMLVFIGLVFLRNLFMCRNTSVATVIERASVKSVEAHKPYPPFTRGHFTVWFLEKGKKQRRFITPPGSPFNGHKEYARAVQVLQETGLLRK